MLCIAQEKRALLGPYRDELAARVTTEGERNDCIDELSCLLIEKLGKSDQNHSLCGSAMEHAMLEWYPRRVAPYDDKKIAENGDI